MNENVYTVLVAYMHHINSEIQMYIKLAESWHELGDYTNEEIRCYKVEALAMCSDDIDSLIHHYYPEIRIIDMLHCVSFIWNIQTKLSKHIDYIMGFGYDYVMHSYHLKASYEIYVELYEYLHMLCHINDVFDGNMH